MTNAAFIAEYNEAVRAGLTYREFAALVGRAYNTVYVRARRLRAAGIDLPSLRHEKPRRPAVIDDLNAASKREADMRLMRFVSDYKAALNDGHTARHLARCIGVSVNHVYFMVHKMKTRGIHLPQLPRSKRSKRQVRRPVAAKYQRSPSPRAPSAETHFVMTVGG